MKNTCIRRVACLASVATILTVACGCGDDTGGTSSTTGSATGDASTGSSGSTGTGGAGGTGAGGGGAGGGSETCGGQLTSAPGADLCGAAPEVDCTLLSPTDVASVCGVPLDAPSAELARSSNVAEFGGSGPPELGCFAPGGYPPKPGASSTVQMSGVAGIFSHGCESKDLTIEVYTVKRTGGPDDGSPDALVGTAVTTPSDCKVAGVASADSDCGTRYECEYTYAGIPTETELLIKTSGALWATAYEYNVYLSNGGVTTHDVQAVAADDYSIIAQVAMGAPVTAGNGAVLGEVHDCGDVRLVNAVVDVGREKKVLTYFTDDETHPLPDLLAAQTGALGMYAALDIAPGPIGVAAVGLSGGQLGVVGFTRARVFPDALTFVTWRGLLPTQVP